MVFKFIKYLSLTNDCKRNTKKIKELPGRKYQGRDRIVYPINSNWVLKVAKNSKGLEQNRAEYEVWKHASNSERNYLCCIRWSDSNYNWIVQRRVQKKLKKYHYKTEKIQFELFAKCEYTFANFKICFHDCNQIGVINHKYKFYDYGLQ